MGIIINFCYADVETEKDILDFAEHRGYLRKSAITPDYIGYTKAKQELLNRAKSVEQYDRELKKIIDKYGV